MGRHRRGGYGLGLVVGVLITVGLIALIVYVSSVR